MSIAENEPVSCKPHGHRTSIIHASPSRSGYLTDRVNSGDADCGDAIIRHDEWMFADTTARARRASKES